MTGFPEFLRGHGLLPPDYIEPGRWMRCGTEDHPRKKNGSFKLCDDERAGFAQNFATMVSVAVWRSGDLAARERDGEAAAANVARRIAREEEEADGSRRARAYYERCESLLGGHPYLTAKGCDMQGCLGLRVDSAGHLVVPMYRDGTIISLQRIAPDGSKLFFSGAPTKGTMYPLRRKGATITILCEGIATGLTLFAAIPQAKVAICFTAAGMEYLARTLSFSGMIVVAADNDHETAARIGRNPGLIAAQNAAASIGCQFALPDCDGTDWNDLFCEALATLEAANERAYFKKPPSALRSGALAKVRAPVMARCQLAGHPPPLPEPKPALPDQSWVKWQYQVESIRSGLVLCISPGGEDEWTADEQAGDWLELETAQAALERWGHGHRLVPCADLNHRLQEAAY